MKTYIGVCLPGLSVFKTEAIGKVQNIIFPACMLQNRQRAAEKTLYSGIKDFHI